MARLTSPIGPRIGADENGLGPRLGPMIVTAAWANVDEAGARQLARKLPTSMRADLDDSKALLSCHNTSLGEAWARAIVKRVHGREPTAPNELFALLSLTPEKSLRKSCPPSTEEQCWNLGREEFCASEEQLERVTKHLATLESRGVDVRGVLCEVTCTGRLNQLKAEGIHRFAADLHCMERLILAFREQAGKPVTATCGKVGGIGKYEPFFGPLAGRLHTALEESQAQSCYYFPTLGELRFVRDADAADPLVMLASLVGKYLRELLMQRIVRFYQADVDDPEVVPSGYHDTITAAFVAQTAKARRRLKIAGDCFERRPAEPRKLAKS